MPIASTNSGRSAVWPIQQYFLQIVPENGLLICTSNLQVVYSRVQVHVQVHLSVFISVLFV